MNICPECGGGMLDVKRFELRPGEKLLVTIPPPLMLSPESCVQLRATLAKAFIGLPTDSILLLQEGLAIEKRRQEKQPTGNLYPPPTTNPPPALRQCGEGELPRWGKIPQAALDDGFEAKILEALARIGDVNTSFTEAEAAVVQLKEAQNILKQHGVDVGKSP